MHVLLCISHTKKNGYSLIVKKGWFCMKKCKLYVSLTDQRVYTYPNDSQWEYEVSITPDYIPIFHRLFEQVNELELRNFFRAHLPYIPYHYDKNNHDIDLRTIKVYALIHEFSDHKTKKFIEALPYFR